MDNKELLIYYNIFGIRPDENVYERDLDIIINHVQTNNLTEKVRIVISAVLKNDEVIHSLKERYGDLVKIFRYDINLPLQVTSNKTILSSIKEFGEEYNGYLHINSDMIIPNKMDFLPRLIEKNNTNEYGIIHCYIDTDGGPWEIMPVMEDFIMGPGYYYNLNVTLFNRSLKDFYGRPLTDIHGRSTSEMTYPYVCAALKKKYIIMGDTLCTHNPMSDSNPPLVNSLGEKIVDFQPDSNKILLWGLKFSDIAADQEAVDAGLGYNGSSYIYKNNPRIDYENEVIQHDLKKYDQNFFAVDDRLKYGIKRVFFIDQKILDYDTIKYDII